METATVNLKQATRHDFFSDLKLKASKVYFVRSVHTGEFHSVYSSAAALRLFDLYNWLNSGMVYIPCEYQFASMQVSVPLESAARRHIAISPEQLNVGQVLFTKGVTSATGDFHVSNIHVNTRAASIAHAFTNDMLYVPLHGIDKKITINNLAFAKAI